MNAIRKYDNHLNVVLVRNNVANDETFEFYPVSPNDAWNEIDKLDNSKKTSRCISVYILKLISDICQIERTNYFNKMQLINELPTLSSSSTNHRYIKVPNSHVKNIIDQLA